MNEETLKLVSGVVEELVAAIPQIVLVLTTVMYSLKAIKTKVNLFPKQMEDTKTQLTQAFGETKEQVNQSLQLAKGQMLDIVKDVTEKIKASVEQTLVDMSNELQTYKKQLQSESDQVNLLVRQNKVFTDIIGSLVAKEPSKIHEGVAKIVAQRTTLSQEELEHYPALLIKELPMLENALKEALVVLGEEQLKELLKKVGYGEINKKV
jgi:hypothetical protein